MMKEPSELARAHAAFERGDYETALEIYQEFAASGLAEGEASLGLLYFLGLGVERSSSDAILWLERAASKGDANAAHNLGTLYMQGMPGVEVDPAEAQSWFKKAKALGFVH